MPHRYRHSPRFPCRPPCFPALPFAPIRVHSRFKFRFRIHCAGSNASLPRRGNSGFLGCHRSLFGFTTSQAPLRASASLRENTAVRIGVCVPFASLATLALIGSKDLVAALLPCVLCGEKSGTSTPWNFQIFRGNASGENVGAAPKAQPFLSSGLSQTPLFIGFFRYHVGSSELPHHGKPRSKNLDRIYRIQSKTISTTNQPNNPNRIEILSNLSPFRPTPDGLAHPPLPPQVSNFQFQAHPPLGTPSPSSAPPSSISSICSIYLTQLPPLN
jgi:hypothetical protein